ncbi:MAG: sensor histidine kinase [Saprospiraceae bacterium]
MKNSIIAQVVILGTFAIIGIIGIQTYWLKTTWNVKQQEFHDKVNIALLNVGKTFEKMGKPLPTYDLIERVSSNYYVVNVNDIINANILEYLLTKELEAVGLTDDFEYGIYDCANGKMVYGNYVGYQADEEDLPPETKAEQLPTYDKYIYYFGVRFPNRTGQILNLMPLTVVFSIILLVTIIFFTYSIFVILRQKQLSEMQKDFINNMTHEFKTPISTMKISADVFLKNEKIQADPRLSRYARIIKEQNNRLNDQVEKVLQLARIERDNFKLKKETLDLHEILEKTLNGVRLKANEKGGNVMISLFANDSIVKADRLHLTNILHNLFDNALKYTNAAPCIRVQTKERNKKIELEISDNGIGIEEEQLPKVFNKFYRVPTGNVHDVKGFGLGLFYVKNICTAHGWEVKLESKIGQGTTVKIIF